MLVIYRLDIRFEVVWRNVRGVVVRRLRYPLKPNKGARIALSVSHVERGTHGTKLPGYTIHASRCAAERTTRGQRAVPAGV